MTPLLAILAFVAVPFALLWLIDRFCKSDKPKVQIEVDDDPNDVRGCIYDPSAIADAKSDRLDADFDRLMQERIPK